jgi:hypothetical protein
MYQQLPVDPGAAEASPLRAALTAIERAPG